MVDPEIKTCFKCLFDTEGHIQPDESQVLLIEILDMPLLTGNVGSLRDEGLSVVDGLTLPENPYLSAASHNRPIPACSVLVICYL